MKSKIPLFIIIAILIFLYAPLLIVVVNSFNGARYGGEWNGFTFKWYQKLFADRNIWDALKNTFTIAAASTLTSVILGTFAAFSLQWFKSRLQIFQRMLIYAPLVIPEILVGISLLLFFAQLNLELGLFTIFIAHVTFSISYVVLVVLGRLQDFDITMLEAAHDLGASQFTAIRRILLPLIAPGIVSGGLMAFILSIDDFVITFFVTGPGSATLPLYIYSMMRHGSPMTINALTAIFLFITFLIIFLSKKSLEAHR